ncbi:hypothetical protein KZ483_25945 [Paenibacillus sp. sptzw28]|uniref:hypothetical protein n=1 Tax=Paenibacillus sp. sptzw28 TaxID=715179 RepID=UPI001C6EDCF5|nr:hypothetical protein [Paenibacillus sp. sptzw28]QYR21117.1 hypothetical protein KZ483_25945 [Paenibacillus sp. sptzw28]
MDQLINKLRLKFLYISFGSILISSFISYLSFQATSIIYENIDHGSIYVRIFNWIINHIGLTPTVIVAGSFLFLLLFFYRSNKIGDDLKDLLAGVQENHRVRIDFSDKSELIDSINQSILSLEKSLFIILQGNKYTENDEEKTRIYLDDSYIHLLSLQKQLIDYVKEKFENEYFIV